MVLLTNIRKTFVVYILVLTLLCLGGCDSQAPNNSEVTTAISEPTTNSSDDASSSGVVARPEPQHMGKVVLCECGPGEVKDETGQCITWADRGATTVPLEQAPGPDGPTEPLQDDTADMSVEVKQPECVYRNVTMQEDQFYLRRRGGLLVTKGKFKGLRVAEYCVHHQVVRAGQVQVTARGCVAKPVVPKCCPSGAYMDNGKCVYKATTELPFKPPLTIGSEGKPFPFDDLEEQERTIELSCPPTHSMTKIWIHGENGYLTVLPTFVGLTWLTEDNKWELRKPPQYCVDGTEDRYTYYAYSCLKDLEAFCENKTCIHKCCPENRVLSHRDKECVPSDSVLTPDVFSNSTTTLYNYPPCSPITDVKNEEFEILSNGSLYYRNKTTYSFMEFCMDNFIGEDNLTKVGALVCLHEIKATAYEQLRSLLNPYLIGLSCAFLALLLLLYSWIPKLMEHEGKHHFYHAASLFIYYIVSGSLQVLLPKGYIGTGDLTCVLLALVMQFTLLCSLFWLNAMCFDEWRNFRKWNIVREMDSSVPYVAPWKYIMYGFGVPTIITCTTIILQFWGPTDGSIVHPRIGEGRCWLGDGKYEIWAYFYGPFAVLSVLNIFFIAKSYHYLRMIRRDYASDTDQSGEVLDSEKTTLKSEMFAVFWQRFYLNTMVTGIWLCDLLSVFIPPPELWAVTDFLNTLQGVFIFFIFLSHERKRTLLKAELPKLLDFTNTWIDETDGARADIHDANKSMAKKLSLNDFISNIFSKSSFNLNENQPNSEIPSAGVSNVSFTLNDMKS